MNLEYYPIDSQVADKTICFMDLKLIPFGIVVYKGKLYTRHSQLIKKMHLKNSLVTVLRILAKLTRV